MEKQKYIIKVISILTFMGIFFIIICGSFMSIQAIYNTAYNRGYDNGLNLECKPIVLAKEIAREHIYNNNESNGKIFNCVNYTTEYLNALRQNNIMASRTALFTTDENNTQIGHQVACILIDPQTGLFIGINQWEEAYSPIWCQASN